MMVGDGPSNIVVELWVLGVVRRDEIEICW